jgi:UDP-N-acetylmuramoyl-tripeptide--D-alanyl-D-alanine ligase
MKTFFKKIIISILEAESRAILKKYKPQIVAVTGSVGKTSTKDAIYTVLASSALSSGLHVRKSEKSFNSEFGVPLTILGVDTGWSNFFTWLKNIFYGLELIFWKMSYPNILVLEVGADHPGDIKRITSWLKPHIGVVTKVSAVPVHVEFFPSRDALLAEKNELAKAVRKDGILVLSEDDDDVKKMGVEIPQRVITFGLRYSAKVTASQETIVYEDGRPVGMSFNLNHEGASFPVFVRGGLGVQHIYPLLAAAAVGIGRGIELGQIAAALSKHTLPRGRMNIIRGIHDSTLIDDTYNSSPDALREALLVLGKIETQGKKIAVLGDMMELGKYSIDEHKKAGELAKQFAGTIVTVGQRMKAIEGAVSFNDSHEAADYVKGIVEKGDVILIKGSQSVRMERVSKAILAEPEKAKDLLVRQEEEWQRKK